MPIEFLNEEGRRPKLLRTVQYGDQVFSRWELEIIHTPIFQRLYDLKQLGFTDRVYPDAVHSRFNHVIGVAEMAEQMAKALKEWLAGLVAKHEHTTFAYASVHADGSPDENDVEITAGELLTLLTERVPVVRLMGLLHDLTHAAFGHTLEDEVRVFVEKHDDPARQKRFFDTLIAQLFYIWYHEYVIATNVPDIAGQLLDTETLERLLNLTVNVNQVQTWARAVFETFSAKDRTTLVARLRELELAMRLLVHIGFAHKSGLAKVPAPPRLLVSDILAAVNLDAGPLPLEPHRDMFLIDLVSNTICADLLDYARRDTQNAGVKVEFDVRLIRYLVTVSVADELSPTARHAIRLAVQFFTDKMRFDVLTGMSAVLKARYTITESMLLHPTKCAAGAMLGTAVQLLGLERLPEWMQVLGDVEFLALLKRLGNALSSLVKGRDDVQGTWEDLLRKYRTSAQVQDALRLCCESMLRSQGAALDMTVRREDIYAIRGRVVGALRLLWHLSARRYSRLAYRLRAGALHSGGRGAKDIADQYSDPGERFKLERRLEDQCHLPAGAVVVHCPGWQPSMKSANVLVVGDITGKVDRLRNVTEVSPENLAPYRDEIEATRRMYESIWQFHVYLDPAHFAKQPLVEMLLEKEVSFPNDSLLREELKREDPTPYRALAGELQKEIAWIDLPGVIERVDSSAVRMRHGHDGADMSELRAIIDEVASERLGEHRR